MQQLVRFSESPFCLLSERLKRLLICVELLLVLSLSTGYTSDDKG